MICNKCLEEIKELFYREQFKDSRNYDEGLIAFAEKIKEQFIGGSRE